MNVHDLAYDFALSDQHGVERHLSTMLEQGPVVLFFFPAALSMACTKESCHFRDLKSEFETLGAQRVGISMDDEAKQNRFSTKYNFDYPLLTDVDGEVARHYGVKRSLSLLRVKRVTFVIGQDQRVAAVISSELDMNTHADRALVALATLGS